MGRRRTDSKVAVRLDSGQLRNPLEIDQIREVGQAQLGYQQQFGTAAVWECACSELAEQFAGLAHRLGTMEAKRREPQDSDSSSSAGDACARTSITAWAPAPISSATPRSARPRPRAETATSGYSERLAGPMCPKRINFS